MQLTIGIIGSRGIPNSYGGFEQFAEYVALGLVEKGHIVSVYNSSNHPFKENSWKGVHIIHCTDLEHKLGTAGQFVYDLNCILDARKRNFDILLFLGYTSSSVWGRLTPKDTLVISNMDGLEWKRTKYSKPVQEFLGYAEKLAVKHSDFLVADSVGIQLYLKERYDIESTFIAYGASVFENPDEAVVNEYQLQVGQYDMLIARIEPENNIEMILDGFSHSESKNQFIVIGSTKNKFGKHIRNRFQHDKRIRFLEAIYNMNHINNLRYYSNLYFHGHTVGGTNPSLLEAMSSQALIAAHNNIFNRSILQNDAFYFMSAEQVRELCNAISSKMPFQEKVDNNLLKIREKYEWQTIIDKYDVFLKECFAIKKNQVETT